MPSLKHLAAQTKGSIYILISVFILAITDSMVPLFAQGWSIWQLLFIRVFSLLPIIAIMLYFGILKLKAISWFYVSLRSLLLTLTVVLYYTSLTIMDLTIAGAGFFTHPIFLWLISFFFLSMRANFLLILALCFGGFGAWLIIDPTSVDFQWIHLFAILSGLFYALNTIVLSRCCQNESTILLFFAYFISSSILGTLALLILPFLSFDESTVKQYAFLLTSWQPLESEYFILASIQAVFAAIAVVFLTKSYQVAEDTSMIAIIEYFYLIFVGIIAYFAWNQSIDIQGLIGIACICLAGIVVIQLNHKKDNAA